MMLSIISKDKITYVPLDRIDQVDFYEAGEGQEARLEIRTKGDGLETKLSGAQAIFTHQQICSQVEIGKVTTMTLNRLDREGLLEMTFFGIRKSDLPKALLIYFGIAMILLLVLWIASKF